MLVPPPILCRIIIFQAAVGLILWGVPASSMVIWVVILSLALTFWVTLFWDLCF